MTSNVRHGRAGPSARRGAVLVAVIVAVVVLSLISAGLVVGGARDHDLMARRVEAMRAFYVMEAGLNMAVRELMSSIDADADGTIGSISDDASDATDPALGMGRVTVRKEGSGESVTLTSIGRLGQSRRSALMTLNFSQTASFMPTVTIDNPGNAPDPFTGNVHGAVAYTYNVGRYEVTNAQYAVFLNAKAASDPDGLYNTNMSTVAGSLGGITRSGAMGSYTYGTIAGRENHPVNHVSFWDAVRFANWLHNGMGSGDTETGAYTLTPDGITANTITRNAGWRWAVTSESEWYKAAYYQPASQGGDVDSYWLYSISSNSEPTTAQANFGNSAGGVVPVTSFTANVNGTFNMGGNVWEWTETITGGNRMVRGSSYGEEAYQLSSVDRFNWGSSNSHASVGFRVVRPSAQTSGIASWKAVKPQ